VPSGAQPSRDGSGAQNPVRGEGEAAGVTSDEMRKLFDLINGISLKLTVLDSELETLKSKVSGKVEEVGYEVADVVEVVGRRNVKDDADRETAKQQRNYVRLDEKFFRRRNLRRRRREIMWLLLTLLRL
jgi:hypothetical protein